MELLVIPKAFPHLRVNQRITTKIFLKNFKAQVMQVSQVKTPLKILKIEKMKGEKRRVKFSITLL